MSRAEPEMDEYAAAGEASVGVELKEIQAVESVVDERLASAES